MGWILTGLRADSSELQTLHGYFVQRRGAKPAGGPMPPQAAHDPWREPDELVLGYARPQSHRPPVSKPILHPLASSRPAQSVRRLGSPFPPNRVVASLFLVPALCGALVWLIGRLAF